MYHSFPSFILAFHSCDLETGLKVLNGKEHLNWSRNKWDWLGPGIYFWEHNPYRAYEYAYEVSKGKQFAKGKIRTPFVIGAILDLKNCLNLTESSSLQILKKAYHGLQSSYANIGRILPENKEANRQLDCEVITYLHQINEEQGKPAYDSLRGAFPEGEPIYKSCEIKDRSHIQICVRNLDCILGYFLPFPVRDVNPHLP